MVGEQSERKSSGPKKECENDHLALLLLLLKINPTMVMAIALVR